MADPIRRVVSWKEVVTFYLRPASAVALAGLMAATLGAGPATADETKAVLELFTSQGCSSCPPADKLFTEYTNRDDVLALSFSVDYWDYLGWKDTLASHDFSERQRDYAAVARRPPGLHAAGRHQRRRACRRQQSRGDRRGADRAT